MRQNDLTLRLEGLTLDTLYENPIRQIAGGRLDDGLDGGIKAAVDRDRQRQKLAREIAIVEKKMRGEKQFNRQVEMLAELGRLKREISSCIGGKV
jgi:hypothetical protein